MRKVVCVTGAGGFTGSWVVKVLLANGYSVHGTVRDPSDAKNAHLYKLENAPENLKLFKAELLDYDSLYAAIIGCSGVFHVASPVPYTEIVPNPEVELFDPTVKGSLNVLKACHETNVKRVVIVSSVGSVMVNPSWPKDHVKDETCWSDKNYCRAINSWYCLSKTEAETEALKYAKTTGLDVVIICPTLILGPLMQPNNINASSLYNLNLLKEGYDPLENRLEVIVDVRDVAEAVVLAYEKPEAEGRYICTGHEIMARDLIEKLRSIFPNYNYPKSYVEAGEPLRFSAKKLQKLGWSYRPLEETLVDAVESYREGGILN